jgi:hypothetical protein
MSTPDPVVINCSGILPILMRQIFIAGRSIGGSDDLATLLSTPAESGSGGCLDNVLKCMQLQG